MRREAAAGAGTISVAGGPPRARKSVATLGRIGSKATAASAWPRHVAAARPVVPEVADGLLRLHQVERADHGR